MLKCVATCPCQSCVLHQESGLEIVRGMVAVSESAGALRTEQGVGRRTKRSPNCLRSGQHSSNAYAKHQDSASTRQNKAASCPKETKALGFGLWLTTLRLLTLSTELPQLTPTCTLQRPRSLPHDCLASC